MIQTLTARAPLQKRCVCLLAIFWLRALAPANADPVQEMCSYSLFKDVDLSRLARGEVLAERAPTMNFPRGLSAQFCYVLPVGLQKAVEIHKNFDASRHPELKVYLSSNISSPPLPGDFSKLLSAPNNESIRSFARATAKHSGLQVSSDEEKLLDKFAGRGGKEAFPPDVADFWSSLLLRRASDFLAGGLSHQPPYSDSFRAADEAAALLKEQARIQARFAPLTAMPGSPALYWQMFDVQGDAALSLGSTWSRQNGGSWQSLDLDCYASNGYYVYLSFVEIWPVKFGTRPATLVWRGDILSSATVGTLNGFEKFIAGNVLKNDVRKNITALLKDAAR